MKKYILFFVLFGIANLYPQEERKVFVEVFTNSHCPLCPPAHTVMNNYLMSPNKDKITYIFYHMIYPYSDDPLYHDNTTDSDGRDDYYDLPNSTPRGIFDGMFQGSYSGWAASLDDLVMETSPLKIVLTGTKDENNISVNANITRSGDIPDNDLVIHFVVVENLYYAGRNGVNYHKNVMRKMTNGATGSSFSISMNETKDVEKQIELSSNWEKDSLKIVVFIQSDNAKTVYQSEVIDYSELTPASDVSGNNNIPTEFSLDQNFPNPFNPSTRIRYQLPANNFVTLKIYNLLGKEVSTLVNENQVAGIYEYSFNAANLPSGIYFYKLTAVNPSGKNLVQTKKMTLIK